MFKRLFGRGGDDAEQPTPKSRPLDGSAQGSYGPAGTMDPTLHTSDEQNAESPMPPGDAQAGGSTPMTDTVPITQDDASAIEQPPAATDSVPPIAGTDPSVDPSAPVVEEDTAPVPPTAEDPLAATAQPAIADEEPALLALDAVVEPIEALPAVDVTPLRLEPLELTSSTTIDDRYVVLNRLTPEEAEGLLGPGSVVEDDDLYAVEDRRSYERCWSCGSANNQERQRFCVDCGAPLGHPQVLARTAFATGAAEEFAALGSHFHLLHPRKQFGATGITLEVGGFSAEGPHHPNEDSYWVGVSGGCFDSVSDIIGVFVLADGMGGYAPGSGLISKEIVQITGRGIFTLLQSEPDLEMQEADLQAVMRGAIAQANGFVLDQISQHGEMGATLVAAAIVGPVACIANIGDSRAYYVAPSGAVTQITRDQSLIEHQIAAGLLSPDAVYTAIGNNVILHAIGEQAVEAEADWYIQPLEPGGRLLLCSDGYWKTMQHDVWDAALATKEPTLRELARAMVDNALARQTDDNTTVLIIGID